VPTAELSRESQDFQLESGQALSSDVLASLQSGVPEQEAVPQPTTHETESTPLDLDALRVRAQTDENNRKNDLVTHQKELEEAQKDVELAVGMQSKIALYTELQAGGPLSEATQKYLDGGGSKAQLETELSAYSEKGIDVNQQAPSEVMLQLEDAREEYMKLSLQRKGILHRKEKTEALNAAEQRYNEAFLAKLKLICDTPAQEALAVGYLPQVVEKLSLGAGEINDIQELAGNHMFVLADMLCREQLERQEDADELNNRGVGRIKKALTSKLARGIVAGAIFTGYAVGLKNGASPSGAGQIAETGLKILSAYFSSRQLLEGAFEGEDSLQGRRERKKTRNMIADDPELADLSLRTAYNAVEYVPEDRHGTEDKEENLQRLQAIQPDYTRMGDTTPSEMGKYSSDMMLAYCKELYTEHRDTLDKIVATGNTEDHLPKLAELILKNDVEKMQSTLRHGRIDRMVFRGVSLLAAVVANNMVDNINNLRAIPNKVSGGAEYDLQPLRVSS
jgi:hypothetical protein